MKKALVVFLILAVAGGLFATPTFSGNLQTGFGIWWDDTDAKTQINYTRDRGGGGVYSKLGVDASGEKEGFGTYGASIGIKTSIGREQTEGGFTDWQVDGGRLWWAPNDLLRIDIGDGGPGGMNTPAACDTSLDVLGGQGLTLRVTPGFGLTLGASVGYGKAVKDVDALSYSFGVKYALADVLTAVANAKYANGESDSAKKLNFAAGVDLGALSVLKTIGFSKVAVDVATNNGLSSDTSYLTVGQAVNFGIGALTLNVSAKELIDMADVAARDYLPIRVQGEVGYTVNDVVKLGLEGRYVTGRVPNWNYQKAGDVGDASWGDGGKDLAALGVSPYVQFSVGPTVIVGYNLQKDISKNATGRTLQHLFYAQMGINF
jgi:hypothetical protein